jgi:hypothetical protein
MKRIVCALLAAVGVGCSDASGPSPELPAEYLAVRRAWAPGERAALIQRILTNREYNFLYVGDVSDLAPQIYADTDSVVVLVRNTAVQGSASGPVPAPALRQFSPTWNFVALKLTEVNNSVAPPDTLFWHMTVWADPVNGGNHGYAIAFSRSSTFNINPINSANFDAANGTAGAAAGEVHVATGTTWIDDAKGGRFHVTSQVYPGGFTTVTSGPFLGGQVRTGTAYGRVNNSNFVRDTGAEAPASFTVSYDYRGTGLPALEIVCVFPTPCTTNALRQLSLRGRQL